MSKIKTIDGERTSVEELNIGSQKVAAAGISGYLQRWFKNVNLIMAGMYTGLNCYGTPKSHHEYEEEVKKGRPDNRPI